jgi:hypothetical protein
MGRRWLEVSDPPWLRFGRLGSAVFLVIGCVLIGTWQHAYSSAPRQIDKKYYRTPGMRGMYTQLLPGFFHFLYYTGKFPITMKGPRREFQGGESRARGHLSTHNPSLMNEDYAVIRTGDLAKVFLLYPDMLRVKSPRRATLWTFNRMLGTGSLVCLFVSLCLVQHRMLGVLLVGLLGSNPFQLYHLYVPPLNIWAYPMCVASLVLALNAPLILARKPNRAAFVLPLLSGVLLASVREVRSEPALVALSLIVAYAIAARMGWRGRVVLISIFAASALLTAFAWGRYWDHKIAEATEIVRRAGGKPFPDLANLHHAIWHPIWWGLGDFGTDKGYRSSDRAAYRYAIPLVNERFGTNYEILFGTHELQNYHSDLRHYRIKPETIPEYSVVLKDKIVNDVRADPVWYLSILAKRVQRAFRGATPIRLGVKRHFVDIPFSAWLALPMLGLVLIARKWEQVALLLFYTPTSLPTVLIAAHWGFSIIAAFHIVAFAVVCCWGVWVLQDVFSRNPSEVPD